MKSDVFAFVDEFGDASIAVQKPGVTSFFIITAVLVSGDLEHHRKQAEQIRAKFFQAGEMKSSTVGSRDSRRLAILAAISQTEISTYTLAVDKRELYRDGGLAHKRSFFKYLNRKLYERISRAHDNVAFVADEHGGHDFMEGFKKYIDDELHPTLFTERTFRFADSREEVLVQEADFISGSWARVWEPSKRSPKAAEMMKLLNTRSVGVEIWPPRPTPEPQLEQMEPLSRRHDELVRRHCYHQAVQFLDEHCVPTWNDERLSPQHEVLTFLLFKAGYADDKAFVSTDEILEHLESRAGIHLSKYQLRTTVIAPLRDAGVIVASGPEGYKIPTGENDLIEFAAHAHSIIPPMLSRLSRARRDLQIASLGTLDILERFTELRRLVESHDQNS